MCVVWCGVVWCDVVWCREGVSGPTCHLPLCLSSWDTVSDSYVTLRAVIPVKQRRLFGNLRPRTRSLPRSFCPFCSPFGANSSSAIVDRPASLLFLWESSPVSAGLAQTLPSLPADTSVLVTCVFWMDGLLTKRKVSASTKHNVV